MALYAGVDGAYIPQVGDLSAGASSVVLGDVTWNFALADKVGLFGHLRETADPDTLRREATAADRELLQGFTDRYLRHAGPVKDCAPCMFTYTLDTDFVVDRVPDLPVVVGCGFSGHGFQHAPGVGQLIAEEITDGRAATIDISPFSIRRFEKGNTATEYGVV